MSATMTALRPTARAMTWVPLAVTAVALALLALALDLAAAPHAGAARPLGLAATAAAVLLGLRDSAAEVTATLPGSRLGRRLLRLALALGPALALGTGYLGALPGTGHAGTTGLLALVAVGLAVATWLPDDARVGLAATVPLAWVGVDLVPPGLWQPLETAAGWWRSESVPVLVAAVGAIALGRHR